MKKISRILLFVLTISILLVSACSGTVAPSMVASPQAEPIPVAFIGTVDSIASDQWVINGQTVTVPPNVIQNGLFNVGDQVKVEGVVNSDGSFTISNVEAPTAQDASTLPPFGNDNSNANETNTNANNGNVNDDNSNNVNSNDDNGNDTNSNDDNNNNANSNDDNGNDTNSNDDNSNNANSNDDNSNDANSNDDNDNEVNSNADNENEGGDNDNDNGNENDEDNDNNGNGE